MALSLGTITGTLELEDKFTEKMSSVTKAGIAGVTAFAASVAAATVALVKMGERGADILDVEGSFAVLNSQIGNSAGVLKDLQDGFKGVVSNTEAMAVTNRALTLGLKLTGEEMNLTAKASRVLADLTGGTVVDAYAGLTRAMATGQERLLRQVGLTIDADAATKKFAASIGKEASELTNSETKLATRNAILEKLRATLIASGEAELDFADQVKRVSVSFENFTDQIAKVIASSPGLNAMVAAVADSFEAMANWVEENDQGIREFVSGSLVLLSQGFSFLLLSISVTVEGIRILSNVFIEAVGSAMKMGLALKFIADVAKGGPLAAMKAWEDFGNGIKAVEIGVAATVKSTDSSAASFTNLVVKAETANVKFAALAANTGAVAVKLEAVPHKANDAATALIKTQEAAKRLSDQLSGKTVLDDIAKFNDAISGMPVTAAILERAKALGDAATKFGVAATGLSAAFQILAAAKPPKAEFEVVPIITEIDWSRISIDPAPPSFLDEVFAGASQKAAQDSFAKLAQEMASAGIPAKDIALALGAAGASSKEAADALEKGSAAAKQIADVKFANIMGAVVGLAGLIGGDVGAALNSSAQSFSNYRDQMKDANALTDAGEQKQAKFAAKIGLASAAAGMLGDKLQNSTNPNVAKLGGALSGAAAGAKMGAAFGPWGAAVGAIGGAVLGFINKAKAMKKELKDIKDKFAESMGGMDELKRKALEAGVSLEAMFKAKNKEALLKSIDEVKGKLQTWDDAHTKLQSAIEKYGITVEELGPKFAQQQMDKKAGELIEAWSLLAAAGVDVGVLVAKMGPDMSAFVDQSVRAGTAIPEAMRASIDALYAAGQLIHDDGTAFTEAEYKALSFSQTMTEQFETLIQKITEMVNALMGIPSDVSTNVNVNTNYTSSGQQDQSWKQGAGGQYDQAFATGGVVTSPRIGLVGEGGPEAIVPLSEMGGMGGPTTAELSANAVRGIIRGVRDALLQAQ